MSSLREVPGGSRLIGFLTLALSAAGCGNGAAEPEEVIDGPYAVVPCPDFGLASTSGLPLDRIAIGDVPGTFGSPVATVMLDEEGEPYGLGYVLESDGGALELTVPVHPVDPVAGGAVTIALTDGISACASVDFVIEGLPDADGELAAVVELLQDMVADQLAILESTPEELRETPIEDVPASLWNLALIQTLLDDPDDERSLLAVSQRDPDDEMLDMVDRLLARSAMRESLESAAATAPLAAPLSAADLSPPARFSQWDLLCSPGYPNTPELLNECMERAAALHRSATGLSRQVADDIQWLFSELGSGRIRLPYAAEISVLFGAAFWIIYAEREAAAAVYPSQLTSISVSVGRDPILEDDPDPVAIQAQVTAGSLGYDMQEYILDGIEQAKGLIDTFGGFDFSTGTVLDDLAEELGPMFEERIRGADIESLQIPAAEFGPVTLADSAWIDARVVDGDAVEIVDDAQYFGRNDGTATLSIRTKDGKFGDGQLADQIVVLVEKLGMTMSPEEVFVVPDAVRTFDVTVTNSKYPEMVELSGVEELQGQAELTIGEGGQHYVTYVAPQEPDLTRPDFLVVEHTAETGAREGKPRLFAQALIRFGGLRITPRPADCLEPGSSVQFQAEIADGLESEVRWSTSAGEIDEETGAWTAPIEAAMVTITAYLLDHPDVRDSVTVTVGCVCSGGLTVGGISPLTTELYFLLDQSGENIIEFGWVSDLVPDDGESDGAQFDLFPPLPVGETGVYEVHGGGLFPDGTFGTSEVTGPLSLTITANEGGERLEGSVVGSVHASWVDPNPSNIVDLLFAFDVRYDPLVSYGQSRRCALGG